MSGQNTTVEALEKAYRDALAKFKADKTNKDLRRARTAAKKAWDEALLKECLEGGDEGARQLNCRDCSQMFLWTSQEQEYYKASERDWQHKPQRCRQCAESQKARRKSQHQLRDELEKETNEENKDDIVRKLGKAGKNMCYAFQRGRCPYGDQCKFNHDPEFAGKKKEDNDESGGKNSGDESNSNSNETPKKRKVVPEVIPICKWGKNCKVKRCRYRHDVVDSNLASAAQPTSQKEVPSNGINQSTTENENMATCIPIPTTTATPDASSTSKKPKVMGICKWGKNCKIKRCRFQHPDDSSPSSTIEETNESNTTATGSNDAETTEAREPEDTIQTKTKTKSKSSEKLVHKALKKALKKAPSNKLKVKDLRKLVQKKMEDMGKDEIKIVVKKTIANNKDSMALVEDGTFVKLIVQ